MSRSSEPLAHRARVLPVLRRLRDRILASPRFQRWAARFPLTRGVARRRAAALFDLCAGFVYSQVFYALVRLRVLEALAEGPMTADELAPRVGLSVAAAERLLDAATSLKLTERRGARAYGLGMHGASYLGNPAVARMVEHHALLYRDLTDPIALLRGETGETELQRFWSYAAEPASRCASGDVAAYSALMASSLPLLAEDVVEAYPFARHRALVDVAGGEGAFLETVAAAAPDLALTLFDLPPVAERGRQRLERAGLASRVTVLGGDVFHQPLPRGADLVSLVRVLHDHDDEAVLAILRAVRSALEPGGVVLVAEPMRDPRGRDPATDAYFGFYLLAMGQGRPRSPEELRVLFERAGFASVRRWRTRRPLFSGLLTARVAA